MVRAMATKTITVCDICGEPAFRQVEFLLDETVRVDLCRAHLAEYRKALRPFAAKATATRPASARTPRARTASAPDRAALQKWGRTKGYRIGDRGRIKIQWLEQARAEGII